MPIWKGSGGDRTETSPWQEWEMALQDSNTTRHHLEKLLENVKKECVVRYSVVQVYGTERWL